MPEMTDDKKMKRGDSEFLFSNKMMTCKWMDYQFVLLLSTALEGLNNFSSVQRRKKGSESHMPKCEVSNS